MNGTIRKLQYSYLQYEIHLYSENSDLICKNKIQHGDDLKSLKICLFSFMLSREGAPNCGIAADLPLRELPRARE